MVREPVAVAVRVDRVGTGFVNLVVIRKSVEVSIRVFGIGAEQFDLVDVRNAVRIGVQIRIDRLLRLDFIDRFFLAVVLPIRHNDGFFRLPGFVRERGHDAGERGRKQHQDRYEQREQFVSFQHGFRVPLSMRYAVSAALYILFSLYKMGGDLTREISDFPFYIIRIARVSVASRSCGAA